MSQSPFVTTGITTAINPALYGGSYITSNNSWADSSTTLKVSNNPSGLEVNGSVVINGKDLEERLDVIEKVLGIPETDPELFKKYPKLKQKYDDYINELAKLRTWEALKD